MQIALHIAVAVTNDGWKITSNAYQHRPDVESPAAVRQACHSTPVQCSRLSFRRKVTSGRFTLERHRAQPRHPHGHGRMRREEVGDSSRLRAHPSAQRVGDAQVRHTCLDARCWCSGLFDLVQG